jgi:alkylated DNA repair dioxygenase AlkB
MFGSIRRLFAPGRSSRACARTQSTLRLESLEGRDVPTVVFANTSGESLSTNATPGLHSPVVYEIFWGSYWQTHGAEQNNLTAATQTLLNSPYFTGLTQYGSDGHVLWGGSYTDYNSPLPGGAIADDNLQNELQSLIDNPAEGLLRPTSSATTPIYLVVTDPTAIDQSVGPGRVAVGFNQLLYYTEPDLFQTTEPMEAVWCSTAPAFTGGPVSQDGFTSTLSHELAECISDPGSTGTVQGPLIGPNGGQIGDGEPNLNVNYTYRMPDGNLVQAYYSGVDNAFIVPDGNTQHIYLQPVVPGGPQFTLNIQGNPRGNITLDTDTNGGVQVTQEGQTFDFAPGQIKGIHISGAYEDQIDIEHTLASAPVTIDLAKPEVNDGQQVEIGQNSQDLGAIQGSVTIVNGTATDVLKVHDELAPPGANQTYTVTDSSITRSGSAGIFFSGLDSSNNVYLYGNSGTNIYWATGTESIVLGDYYGANGHANMEAVVLQGSSLNHYYRDADTLAWHYDGTICTDATGPGSLILGDYVSASGHHNLEVVVQEGGNLNAYYRDADTLAWHYDATIVTDASGPASLILGDYVGANGHHNMELVVQEGSNLNAYYRDADTLQWHYDATIVTDATGPGSLILGDYVGVNGHRNLELVVQEGSNLNAYYRDADTLAWHYDATICTDATGPASLILGDYVGANGHRNLEVVVQEGNNLNAYYRDANSLAWQYDATIVTDATGPASLIRGDYVGPDGHRNLEITVQEGGSLKHYYRDAASLNWDYADELSAPINVG